MALNDEAMAGGVAELSSGPFMYPPVKLYTPLSPVWLSPVIRVSPKSAPTRRKCRPCMRETVPVRECWPM